MPIARKHQTDAAGALIAVAPLVNRWVERVLAEHHPPLTVAQYLALRTIAGEQVTGAELARRAGVSGPAVSQLLAALADSGMLERTPDPADRRHHALRLSAAGALTFRSADARLRQTVGKLLVGVPPPEAQALGRLLGHVEAALGGSPPPRKPPRPPKAPGGGPSHPRARP